jgi:hypothetical protein
VFAKQPNMWVRKGNGDGWEVVLKAWGIQDLLHITLGRSHIISAGPEKAVLKPRTAATQAVDVAAFRLGGPHVNGVQAELFVPIDWDWLIPPWLHLILGTGNEVVKNLHTAPEARRCRPGEDRQSGAHGRRAD